MLRPGKIFLAKATRDQSTGMIFGRLAPISPNSAFKTGQVFTHKTENYRGVILCQCQAKHAEFDNSLDGGISFGLHQAKYRDKNKSRLRESEQPYYRVLVHEDDHFMNKKLYSTEPDRDIYTEPILAPQNQEFSHPTEPLTEEEKESSSPASDKPDEVDAFRKDYNSSDFQKKSFKINDISGYDIVDHGEILPLELNWLNAQKNYRAFKNLKSYFKHDHVETFFQDRLWWHSMDRPLTKLDQTHWVKMLVEEPKFSNETVNDYKSLQPHGIESRMMLRYLDRDEVKNKDFYKVDVQFSNFGTRKFRIVAVKSEVRTGDQIREVSDASVAASKPELVPFLQPIFRYHFYQPVAVSSEEDVVSKLRLSFTLKFEDDEVMTVNLPSRQFAGLDREDFFSM